MRKIYLIILCAVVGLAGCANLHQPQNVDPPYSSSSQTSKSETTDDVSDASNYADEEEQDKIENQDQNKNVDPSDSSSSQTSKSETTDDVSDASNYANEEEQDEIENQDENKLDIITPIIFAEHEFSDDFPQHTGKKIVLELVNGSYDRSMHVWNRDWAGNFHFRLTNTHELLGEETEGIISFPISLSFNEPFALTVDDYNSDGKPDFALSQYGSMTGGDYCAIFTLNDNGTVEILPFNAIGERYITMFGMIGQSSESTAQMSTTFLMPYTHTDNSPLLIKNGQNGFSVTYPAYHGLEVAHLFDEEVLLSWDDEHSRIPLVRDVYQWRDSAFMLITQEILKDDGTVWKSSSNDFINKE